MDDGWNITVNLSLLRQKYPDFNPDECYIGLDNSNCTGHVEENQLHFGQNFEDCKTSEKVNLSRNRVKGKFVCFTFLEVLSTFPWPLIHFYGLNK